MKKINFFKMISLVAIVQLTLISTNSFAENKYALDFTSQYVRVGDDASNNLDVTSAWTFECWFNADAQTGYDDLMFRNNVFNFSLRDKNATGSGDFGVYFRDRASSINLGTEANENLSFNTWYHVAATYDGTTARLYVDGIEVDSDGGAWNLATSSNSIFIARRSTTTNYFNGQIDEIRMSNIARATTAMQLSSHEEEYTSDANTIFLMHFNDQANTPTYISGVGHAGTVSDNISSSDYLYGEVASGKLLRPEYRSKVSGNWNASSSWEYDNTGSANWVDASLTPSYYDDAITILNGHTITVTADVEIDQATIASGGKITVSDGYSLTIKDGTGTDLTIDGTLRKEGTGNVPYSGTLAFNDGGKFELAGTNKFIPVASWDDNSTCEITGAISGDMTSTYHTDQEFGNFTWNCTGQTDYVYFSGALTNIDGDFTLISTNSHDFRLTTTAGADPTVDIAGDVDIQGGVLNLTSGDNNIYFICNGDYTQSGGTIKADGAGTGYLRFGPLSGSGYSGTFTHSGGTFTPEDIQINESFTLTLGSNMNPGTAPVTIEGVFTVPSSYTYTIPTGGLTTLSGDMTVNGTLTNLEGNAGLVIEANGSLIESNGVSATVEQHLSADAWHLVSLPIASAQSSVYFDLYLYEWVEADSAFTEITSTTYGLSATHGYYAYSSSGVPSPTDVEFTGNLNTGDKAVSWMTYTSLGYTNGDGWNLVGNPYVSGLTWDNTWSQSNLDPTVYVNDEAGTGNWLVYNYNSPGTATLPNGEIPATQGFFVKANATSPSMTIPNSARVHTSNDFYKGSENNEGIFNINITSNENDYSDKLFVGINADATNNFDSQLDAYKLMGLDAAPQLYAFDTETKFSVNLFPEFTGSKSMSLGLRVETAAEYTLNADDLENFDTGIEVYLQDNVSGEMINLRENPVYTFYAEPGLDESRFVLHFNPEFAGIDPTSSTSDISIYAFDKTVFVNYQLQDQSDIMVYDISGRLIASEKVQEGLNEIIIQADKGYYFVKVISSSNIKTQKVFIK